MLKSSYNYWKKREAEQYQNNIRDLERYNAYIEEIYQRMQDEINKEIEAFYAKYADKEGITMAAAKKMADKLDIEEYARKAKRYVQDKDFSDQANREMRLYNMTMKVNRLELLRAKLGLEMVAANDEMTRFFKETLTDKATSEFRRQSGILGMTVLGNEKKAHSIVNASFHNANWSERIWASQDELRGVLDQELQRGLIRGLNPRTLTGDLKKYIKKDIDKVKYSAERLMRTELARVQTDAQFKSYEDAGYTEYMFIANGKTACKHCMELDGEHFKIEDMEIAENAPPMHPNCMCSTAPWMDRTDNVEMFRAQKPNRYRDTNNHEVISKALYNKIVASFIKNGGIIIRGEEAERHLKNEGSASYIAGANIAFIKDAPTVSDVLEEMYHAKQDKTHKFGESITREVILKREIDAQKYLLSVAKKYKINDEEILVTKNNLNMYEEELKELLEKNGL